MFFPFFFSSVGWVSTQQCSTKVEPTTTLVKPSVGRISIRHCSTKGSASQLLRFEPTIPNLQSGFTLIELLVVVFLLAIIAGVAVLSYDGVQDQGRYDATQFEMAEIRKALVQFRRDSGSHDFPTQGVYACANVLNFPSYLASFTPAEKQDWCNSPANFWMLFENPLDDLATSDVEEGGWDADRRRGWHGPYLQNKQALINYAGIDTIPSVMTPYDSPYLMLDLAIEDASILSMGANDVSGAISGCVSSDEDDRVVCLLK